MKGNPKGPEGSVPKALAERSEWRDPTPKTFYVASIDQKITNPVLAFVKYYLDNLVILSIASKGSDKFCANFNN